LLVGQVPVLRSLVVDVVGLRARTSMAVVTVVTVVSAIAEEVFLRGAVFVLARGHGRLRRHVVPLSVGLGTAAVLATLNPMLVFAAVVLGAVAARQRATTGSLLAPVVLHVTWSTAMLWLLGPALAA